MQQLQDAFADEDIEGICALMSRSAERQAGSIAHSDPTTCIRDVGKVIGMIDRNGGWDGSEPPRVIDVTGKGDRRTATVMSDDGWRATLPFVRERGRWRLDGFFGTTPRHIKGVQAAAPRRPFPRAGAEPVAAVDSTGERCSIPSMVVPPLKTGRFPYISGGCVIKVSSKRAPVRMLTPFGDFKFSDCSIRYVVHVGGDGRTWTDKWEVFSGSDSGCSDVNVCVVPGTYGYQPWKGRLRYDGNGGYLHVVQMCLYTCVGQFAGDFVTRLEEEREGWRLRPTRSGTTGFLIDSDLAAAGDVLVLHRPNAEP